MLYFLRVWNGNAILGSDSHDRLVRGAWHKRDALNCPRYFPLFFSHYANICLLDWGIEVYAFVLLLSWALSTRFDLVSLRISV